MPDEPIPAPGPALVGTAYVQLISAHEPNERLAAAALVTPDEHGRLPVVVRVGGPSLIRWEPVAGAIGIIGFAVIFSPPPAFFIGLLVVAALLVILSLLGRFFIRVPEGAWGLVSRRNRQEKTYMPGNYVVIPWFALTHLVARRDFVFDAPVTAAPSAEGVRVDVDVLVTFRIVDPARFVYQVSVADFDQFAQAAIQDSVRSLVRGMSAIDALDLGSEQATRLKAGLGKQTGPFGVEVSAVAFTRVTLPSDMTASFEEQRLAFVQQEEEAARAGAEDLRLKLLDQRLKAHPDAARYDLQMARLRVARELATNTRAVVGLDGASELNSAMILAADEAGDEPPAGPKPPAAPKSATSPSASTRSSRAPRRPG
jgi:regulator of protease activity HflC (stomatin/prohibitin superfamily)